MPIMDGLDFIEKAVMRWPDMPIVVVSGVGAIGVAEPVAADACEIIIRDSSGSHFDPAIVELFFANIDGPLSIKNTWVD